MKEDMAQAVMREARASGEKMCLNSRVKVKAERKDAQRTQNGERCHGIQ